MNMFKKFFTKFHGFDAELDEMLALEQKKVTSGGFWLMYGLSFFLLLFCANILGQPSIVAAILFWSASLYYLVSIWRHKLPILPTVNKEKLMSASMTFCVLFSLAMAIRNVFFLYGDFTDALIPKITAAFGITVIVTAYMMILFWTFYWLLSKLARKQEQRIQQQIEAENND